MDLLKTMDDLNWETTRNCNGFQMRLHMMDKKLTLNTKKMKQIGHPLDTQKTPLKHFCITLKDATLNEKGIRQTYRHTYMIGSKSCFATKN